MSVDAHDFSWPPVWRSGVGKRGLSDHYGHRAARGVTKPAKSSFDKLSRFKIQAMSELLLHSWCAISEPHFWETMDGERHQSHFTDDYHWSSKITQPFPLTALRENKTHGRWHTPLWAFSVPGYRALNSTQTHKPSYPHLFTSICEKKDLTRLTYCSFKKILILFSIKCMT